MPVSVASEDIAGAWKRANRDGSEVVDLRFTPTQSASSPPDREAFVAFSDSVGTAMRAVEEVNFAGSYRPAARNACVIENGYACEVEAETESDLRGILSSLSAALEGASWSGLIDLLPAANTPVPTNRPGVYPAATLLLGLESTHGPRAPISRQIEAPSAGVCSHLADIAAALLPLIEGEVILSAGTVRAKVSLAAAPGLFKVGLANSVTSSVQRSSSKNYVGIAVDHKSCAVIQLQLGADLAPEAIARLQEVGLSCAPMREFIALTAARNSCASLGQALLNSARGSRPRDLPRSPIKAPATGLLPDAFPWQIVPDQIAANAPQSDRWHVEPLTPERSLLKVVSSPNATAESIDIRSFAAPSESEVLRDRKELALLLGPSRYLY